MVVGVLTLAATSFAIEVIRCHEGLVTRPEGPMNPATVCARPILFAFATGAITCAVLCLVANALIVSVALLLRMFLSRPTAYLSVGALIAIVWIFAFLTSRGVIVPLERPPARALIRPPEAADQHAHAATLTLAIVLASQMGAIVRRKFDGMLQRAVWSQQAVLTDHARHILELNKQSAELAHELKNPLASIKGLATLLADDAEGKGAERLKVLRDEVARMQTRLDAFLSLGRPAVPSSPTRIDLESICADVITLHEGLAHERGLRLVLRCEQVAFESDPDQLQQILANLVQNAIEASSRYSQIVVEGRLVATGQICICVIDEGRGIDPALGDVFAAGVSSKSRGAGLGLAIARSLARQLGGDLMLVPHWPGGTTAHVMLPRRFRGWDVPVVARAPEHRA